jgi:hypothetical protein
MAYVKDTSDVCEILDSAAEAALIAGPVRCENPECTENHYQARLTDEQRTVIRHYAARYMRALRQIPVHPTPRENLTPMEILRQAFGGPSASLLEMLISLVDIPQLNALGISDLSRSLAQAVNSHAEKFKSISFAREMADLTR